MAENKEKKKPIDKGRVAAAVCAMLLMLAASAKVCVDRDAVLACDDQPAHGKEALYDLS